MSNNAYLHCPYAEPLVANAWDIDDATAVPEAECAYFREVFLALEREGSVRGVTFVVTSSVDVLPSDSFR